MEKTSALQDFIDSGAKTTGDLSMGDGQDPFLVSIHIIADPGQAKMIQRAADQVLSWLHPELTLFRVSERATGPLRRSKQWQQNPFGFSPQPSLAVILFLQEDYGDEESQEYLHGQLRKPPWCYHHTERVNGRGVLPLSSASQDFFTLAPGTPLWALRQVHYGKEIVRLTIYCRYETYNKQVQLYRLLLCCRLAQRKEDFCFCVVYCNRDMEIQLSFKRMPQGQKPIPTECAIMEIRVRDVGGLVPLLPHPCMPISDVRWQTGDYDGNRILLQVPGSWKHHRHTIAHRSCAPSNSFPEPSPPASEPSHCLRSYARGPASYRTHRNCNLSHSHAQKSGSPHTRASQTSLPLLCEEEYQEHVQKTPKEKNTVMMGLRSCSTISLPTEGVGYACTFPRAPRPRSLSLLAAPVFHINIDALVGAEETDVDTGQAVSNNSIDLSVVSAYVCPQKRVQSKARIPQPRSSTLQDKDHDLTAQYENTYHSLKRQATPSQNSKMFSASMPCIVNKSLENNAGPLQADVTPACTDGIEEDGQEFYI